MGGIPSWIWLGATTAIVLLAFPASVALHETGCVPSRADPETTVILDTTDGRRFYLENREDYVPGAILNQDPFPVNLWIYEEANDIDAPEGSLQRGNPGIDPCFPPPLFPCVLFNADPITDQSCGHGPDALIF